MSPMRPERHFADRPRRPGAAWGWAASAGSVALCLSGLAALAMSVAPPGESSAEIEQQAIAIVLPPAPAVAALSEAAPAT
ncbi:hypothetical protein, partial [Xinfangfangia pollutisoli]|uniref:hypothetical protein n=1 Tax=Xinfangfangia pollutisoli TaxID=2865960 RepID=UPI001CD79FFF